VLLPVGSLEQHGTEAPLGCDGIIAEALCRSAGEKTGCAVLPGLYYGNSLCHTGFPGTFSLSVNTYRGILSEIIREAGRNGYQHILILSGHGGNRKAALEAVKNAPSNISAEYLGFWELAGFTAEEERLFGKTGHHVTTSEVSIVWHLLGSDAPGNFQGKYPDSSEGIWKLSPEEWRLKFPDGGVGGNMALVSVQKGRKLFKFSADALAEKVNQTISGG